MSRFAIIGAAGYVAPKHLQAIKSVGGEIVAALDPSDSVGILDSYGYDISYFREFERFERYLTLLDREGRGVDYVSICSPNYLHDAHIRFVLRIGASAICEKPLVISPWNLDALEDLEAESDGRVYPVLQLRYHPFAKEDLPRQCGVLMYNAPRGRWYDYSWKGDEAKSGGVLYNIGVHLFDILIHHFGVPEGYQRFNSNQGMLHYSGQRIVWDLATDPQKRMERTFKIAGKVFDLSKSFTNLHDRVYSAIMEGEGLGIEDARPSIELIHRIRNGI